MELFTSDIKQKLQAQYHKGNRLEVQEVICKIFNPYGIGTWYLINQDPSDPDYIWCIAVLYEVEIGSASKRELEEIRVSPDRVPPFGLSLERDLYFQPINAAEAYQRLLNGEHL